jgi:hypothetical protein
MAAKKKAATKAVDAREAAERRVITCALRWGKHMNEMRPNVVVSPVHHLWRAVERLRALEEK